jgi:hypothetical protein
VLQVLHPLEIGDDPAASVGVHVGDHKHAVAMQDLVRGGRRRIVGALDDCPRTYVIGAAHEPTLPTTPRPVAEGTLMLDFDGERVGKVTGLSLLDLGDYAFGRPVRITASAGRHQLLAVDL